MLLLILRCLHVSFHDFSGLGDGGFGLVKTHCIVLYLLFLHILCDVLIYFTFSK